MAQQRGIAPHGSGVLSFSAVCGAVIYLLCVAPAFAGGGAEAKGNAVAGQTSVPAVRGAQPAVMAAGPATQVNQDDVSRDMAELIAATRAAATAAMATADSIGMTSDRLNRILSRIDRIEARAAHNFGVIQHGATPHAAEPAWR